MDIVGIKHDGMVDSLENYICKLSEAMKNSPDLVVGPDYSLYPWNNQGEIDFDRCPALIRSLVKISKKNSNIPIIAGTIPRVIGGEYLAHSALVLNRGILTFFDKETDVENSRIALKNGLKFRRGDNKKNFFYLDGRKISIQICSDHGKQPVDEETFLEIILAYDKKAGFYLRPPFDRFSRTAIVCDGLSKNVSGFNYDPKNLDSRLSFLPQQSLNSDLEKIFINENSESYI